VNEKNGFIKEIESLLQVEKINSLIKAKVIESKMLFKEDIDNYFLGKIKVIPFPAKGSTEYPFSINRASGITVSEWNAVILNKKFYLPWESILPYDLIEQIGTHPINCDETVQIRDIMHKGNRFNISFIKYLEDSVVGIIQRIREKGENGQNVDISTLDMCQYLELPEEEQVDIFLKYFKSSAPVRQQILFNFFTHIMPVSVNLREVT